MMKNLRWRRILFLLIPVTFLSMLVFFFLLGSHVSADTGNINDLKGYESVLIKDGDTISSLASSYAEEYSHFTKGEYVKAIVSLNNLSSEYIQSGSYLLLPKYH